MDKIDKIKSKLFRFLKDNDALIPFINNFTNPNKWSSRSIEYKNMHDLNELINYLNPAKKSIPFLMHEILDAAFLWRSTKEGYCYWLKLNRKIRYMQYEWL